MLDGFWKFIEAQLKELESARTADDVIRTMRADDCVGDAFFAGSGGDESVWGALHTAGWTTIWVEADYYFAMRAPDGSAITYVEGDIYRGDQRA
ncbi:hypothetical protein J7I97_16915 [Streptomyces sp. ISL-87]|uniref:hypothetical protein n=1 Tax=Streptomyces sp. ISL-87 TaxID=2819188 RepID=UPI001BEA7C10|nr:hypothetical protein [Streptomyces sp. ISL-87]MBT2609909.1 hypothetical protein [Streptomyces sp. ISL-87]